MKIINLKIDNYSCTCSFPAYLTIIIGQISKENDITYILLSNDYQNTSLISSIQNLMKYYEIHNIYLNTENIDCINEVHFQNKHGLSFPNSNINESESLKAFIEEFESLYGILPFYSQKNKYIEKFLFINDIILNLCGEITVH